MNKIREQQEDETMIEYQKNIKENKKSKTTLLPLILVALFVIFMLVAGYTFTELLLHPTY